MKELGIRQDELSLWPQARAEWQTRVFIVLATGLIALCAHIAVPLGFTPVPLTLQPFAVLLLGLIFTPGAAFWCLGLYLLEGMVGLPVFTPTGPGGIAQLLGPTGGYLLSYPLVAPLASWLYRRGPRRFVTALAASAAASLLILAAGATWLGVLTHAGPSALWAQSIAPFLPGDAIKVVAAAGCASLLTSFGPNRRDLTL